MNKIRLIYFVILFSALAACKPVSYLTVEIADPPAEILPDEIQSLALVDRAVNQRFQNESKDSIQLFFYKSQFQKDTILLDQQAADTLLRSLGYLLYGSGRFDIVIPENRFLNQHLSSEQTGLMDWKDAENICAEFQTDAILSIDYFNTTVTTTYDKQTLYSPGTGSFYNAYLAQMKIGYQSLMRVYDPVKKQILKSIIVSDTLVWEESDADLRALFNRFINVKTGLIESGIDAALQFSEKIAPNWKTVRRKYFSKGNAELVAASPLVLDNNWDEALEKWQNMASTVKSKSLKSKVEFNIALGYEMQGDLTEAIRWGVKSYETIYRPITYDYLNTLKLRKIQFDKANESDN